MRSVESFHCPNSTDGGMPASNHKIAPDGYCMICERSARSLMRMHGIEESS